MNQGLGIEAEALTSAFGWYWTKGMKRALGNADLARFGGFACLVATAWCRGPADRGLLAEKPGRFATPSGSAVGGRADDAGSARTGCETSTIRHNFHTQSIFPISSFGTFAARGGCGDTTRLERSPSTMGSDSRACNVAPLPRNAFAEWLFRFLTVGGEPRILAFHVFSLTQPRK